MLSALKDIEENQKHMQSANLQSSIVWKGKSLELTTKLSEVLRVNSKLTELNLVDCSVNDAGLSKLAATLTTNASLFHLNLSNNKFGRPALLELGKALVTNTGLISLELSGIRVDGSVCACFIEAFGANFTLCKLVWDPEISGYNLKFTEMLNRNSEIDRAVRDGKPFEQFLPAGVEAPKLAPRVVPDPDEDEYALEVGEDSAKVWCQIGGRWELGEVQGRRGVGQRRKLVVRVEETEHEIDPKSVTQFERARPVNASDPPSPRPTPHPPVPA